MTRDLPDLRKKEGAIEKYLTEFSLRSRDFHETLILRLAKTLRENNKEKYSITRLSGKSIEIIGITKPEVLREFFEKA